MFYNNSKFLFGTKAETLERISKFVSLSDIPKFLYFNATEWKAGKDKILKDIKSTLGNTKVVVRSSACSEDNDCSSLAGFHNSVLDINSDDVHHLSESIKDVIGSYMTFSHHDQVLVQQMIKDVSMSGVVFTQDMNTGAPYFVINYDDQSGRTDTVTSGNQFSNKTLLVHREALRDFKSERFKSLVSAVREIEEITGHDSLDIEFGVGKNNQVYIFQVRKITTRPNWNRGLTLKVNDAVKRLKKSLSESFTPVPGIYGSRTIFTQMSDWNPAEMIGSTPRPLAFSLYNRLITSRAWREARRQMGYAEPKGAPLMVSFFGHPYIDVRLSFHSFLPCDIEPPIANKLVDAWLNRLGEHRELHDKIEFEVAITALTFDFEESVERLFPGILSKDEKESFRKSLFLLTNNLLTGKVASIEGELKKIQKLGCYRLNLLEKYQNPELLTVSNLLENCIDLGTIPFSILARHAFTAVSFLRSLVSKGVLDETDVIEFQQSIRTIAGDLVVDMELVSIGSLPVDSFMEKYGHLRPGTYDILSMRYDQRKNLLNEVFQKPLEMHPPKEFIFSKKKLDAIKKNLNETGFDIPINNFLEYLKNAIKAREYAKFVFTKNISDSLEIITAWGEQIGLGTEDISYLTIEDLLNTLHITEGRTIEQYLREKANEGRKKHELSSALRLPHLIDRTEDVSIIPLLLWRPNFVTDKTFRGCYVFIDGRSEKLPDISGKIVLIEGADPGFDWIFSCSPAALVTKFGGANSHMAIRCAEFGLPAAIGVGEQIFDRILRSQSVEINCSERRIVPF